MTVITSTQTDWPADVFWPVRLWARIKEARRLALVVGFLLAYFALETVSYTQRSATYDEPLHLAAGYAALAKRDYRVDPTHPPLVRMLAALPLLGMPEVDLDTGQIDRLDQFAWMSQNCAYSHHFLFGDHDADHLLNWARFMVVILGALLGLVLFSWVEDWLGFLPAGLVLVFLLLEPNLAAHAGLVTTDLGVTLFYAGTIFFLWRTCRSFSAGNIAGLALCFALALVAKFSAVLLVPTGAALLAFAVGRSPAMTWRRAAGLGLLLAATGWLAIWAAYGFRYAPSDTAGWLLETDSLRTVREELPLASTVADWVDAHRLLPNGYTRGFLVNLVASAMQPAYLAGEVRQGGWWYYFPFAFLVKTPVALIVLAGAGTWFLWWNRASLGRFNAVCVLLPPAVYLAAAMGSGINIGLRHILPVYPFVLLLSVLAVHQILAAGWPARAKWLVLGLLAARWLFSFAGNFPHTLTYFNLLAGGPLNGREYLADSNLDWGQHLKRLKAWMDRQQVGRINLAYFGMGDPAYYGIDCNLLPGTRDFLAKRIAKPRLPGYVGIGATVLSGAYLSPEWRLFYDGFQKLKPVAVVGNSLYIYWVDEWPKAGLTAAGSVDDEEVRRLALLGDELARLGWHDEAIQHYRQFLALRPDSAPAHAALGEALLAARRTGEAVEEFRRAVKLEPAAPLIRSRFAAALLEQGDVRGAVAETRQAVDLQPDNARMHDLLGVALAHHGEFAAAEAAFMEARALDPDDAVIRQHLARVRASLRAGGPSWRNHQR